jgi:hypothetical protein
LFGRTAAGAWFCALADRDSERGRFGRGTSSDTVTWRARFRAALHGAHRRAPGSLGPWQIRQPFFFDVRPDGTTHRFGKVIVPFTAVDLGQVAMTLSS